jgi:hypothetical protein
LRLDISPFSRTILRPPDKAVILRNCDPFDLFKAPNKIVIMG